MDTLEPNTTENAHATENQAPEVDKCSLLTYFSGTGRGDGQMRARDQKTYPSGNKN